MPNPVYKGKFTAETEDGFVVFIIGVRLNNILAFPKWISTIMAMMPMIKELYENPELGFKQEMTVIGWRTVTTIQYWKSHEQLEAYAKGQTHSKALKEFYKKIGKSGSIGLFHETYKIDQDESFYFNMPVYGLAKAFSHMRIGNKNNTSMNRMHRKSKKLSIDKVE